MVVIRETDRPRRVAMNRRRTVLDYPERVADTHPETLAWIARIEEMRREVTDPICTTCGSSTPESVERKWCPRCQAHLMTARFSRDRARHDGLHPICKACESARGKEYRRQIARGIRRSA